MKGLDFIRAWREADQARASETCGCEECGCSRCTCTACEGECLCAACDCEECPCGDCECDCEEQAEEASGSEEETMEVHDDGQHMAITGAPGSGKSDAARAMLSQALGEGAAAVVLDPEVISQRWARGLPGVEYASATAEMHAVLLRIGEVVRTRLQAGEDGPRTVVLVEEMNHAAVMLRDYWWWLGGKGQSPALAALDLIAHAGRQAGVCLITTSASRPAASARG